MESNDSPRPTSDSLKSKLLAFYNKHERYAPATFFILGFLFDVVTLSRIDDNLMLLQQAGYLSFLAIMIGLEIELDQRPRDSVLLRGRLGKLWNYRELAVHFVFGSLLSLYTLFFFKSASFQSSFVFMVILAAALVGNEVERLQKLGPYMRLALLSLCFTCFFCCIVPIVFGFGGILPFAISLTLSSLCVFGLFLFHARGLTDVARSRLQKRALWPGFGVQLIFLLLYLFALIPPVPLSAQYMGIYHALEKKDGRYALFYDREAWRFWESGAQTFKARPGDKIYVFTRVFSPRGFRDQISVRWLFDDPKQGWVSSDAIPLAISGGRDEGFRGYAFKQNFTMGSWMVKLETTDGREISRIRFTVVPDVSSGERTYFIDRY